MINSIFFAFAIVMMAFSGFAHANTNTNNEAVTTLPEVSVTASVSDLFSENLRNEVGKNVRYPESAKRWNVQGVTMLRVSYSAEGDVSVEVEESSGSNMLDAAAVYAAKGADRNEVFGIHTKFYNAFEYKIPVSFKLN